MEQNRRGGGVANLYGAKMSPPFRPQREAASPLQQCPVSTVHHADGLIDQSLRAAAFGRAFPGRASERVKTRIDKREGHFAASDMRMVGVDQAQHERHFPVSPRSESKFGRRIVFGKPAQVPLQGSGCRHANGEAFVRGDDVGVSAFQTIAVQPYPVFAVWPNAVAWLTM